MDSIHAVIWDSLRRIDVTAKSFSTSNGIFDDYVFPLLLLVFGAAVSLISSLLTTHFSNKHQVAQAAIKEKQKSLQEIFIRLNDVDRESSNVTTWSYGSGTEPLTLIRHFQEKVDQAEILYKNQGYLFNDELSRKISDVISYQNQFCRNAAEIVIRNGYAHDPNSSGYDRNEQQIDDLRKTLRTMVDNWRGLLVDVESGLKKMAR